MVKMYGPGARCRLMQERSSKRRSPGGHLCHQGYRPVTRPSSFQVHVFWPGMLTRAAAGPGPPRSGGEYPGHVVETVAGQLRVRRPKSDQARSTERKNQHQEQDHGSSCGGEVVPDPVAEEGQFGGGPAGGSLLRTAGSAVVGGQIIVFISRRCGWSHHGTRQFTTGNAPLQSVLHNGLNPPAPGGCSCFAQGRRGTMPDSRTGGCGPWGLVITERAERKPVRPGVWWGRIQRARFSTADRSRVEGACGPSSWERPVIGRRRF